MTKLIKYLSVFLLFAVFIVSGCKDRTDITAPPAIQKKSGNADFSRFVTIGNSLTAGYQSGSLFESAQMYSFGNLIAQQVNTDFAQPTVTDPGTVGRLEIKSLNPFTLSTDGTSGTPDNTTYPAPYNNLGVPGAFVYDILNATNANDCYTAKYAGQPNPMFNLVLRGLGTQFQQAKALHPTFVTLWIGNNDVLGYATAGGTVPYTPVNQFAYLYSQVADSIASLGAKVVVANIPNVASIPFFTTVGPQIAMTVPWTALKPQGVVGLFYAENGQFIANPTTDLVDSLGLLTGKVLITLKGSEYASLLGHPTGKFYRDNHISPLPPGVDTTKPFGFHPQNPWPDALILDPNEIKDVQSTVAAYNSTIASVAQAHDFGLVDVYSFFNNVRAADFSGGTMVNGIDFKTTFVEGGIFGLDGVHPTSQGYGIVANEFIKVINSKFNANIPLINVSTIPGSLQFVAGSMNAKKAIHFPQNAFEHLFF